MRPQDINESLDYQPTQEDRDAYAEVRQDQQSQAKAKTTYRIHTDNNFKAYSLIEGKKIKETEKAIYLEDSMLHRRWFPKSQIRHEEGDIYRIPRWMANDPELDFCIYQRYP